METTTTVQLITLSTFNYDTLINETNVLNKYKEYLSENSNYFSLPQGRLVLAPLNKFMEKKHRIFSEKLTVQFIDYTKEFTLSLVKHNELLELINSNNQYKTVLVFELKDLTKKESNLLTELLPFFQLVNNYRTEYKVNNIEILDEDTIIDGIAEYCFDTNFDGEDTNNIQYQLKQMFYYLFNKTIHNPLPKNYSYDEYDYFQEKIKNSIQSHYEHYSKNETILDSLKEYLPKNNNFNYPEIDESRETESDYKNMDSIEKYY